MSRLRKIRAWLADLWSDPLFIVMFGAVFLLLMLAMGVVAAASRGRSG